MITFSSAQADPDPQETHEWLEALDGVNPTFQGELLHPRGVRALAALAVLAAARLRGVNPLRVALDPELGDAVGVVVADVAALAVAGVSPAQRSPPAEWI